jgi:hypothetical protein
MLQLCVRTPEPALPALSSIEEFLWLPGQGIDCHGRRCRGRRLAKRAGRFPQTLSSHQGCEAVRRRDRPAIAGWPSRRTIYSLLRPDYRMSRRNLNPLHCSTRCIAAYLARQLQSAQSPVSGHCRPRSYLLSTIFGCKFDQQQVRHTVGETVELLTSLAASPTWIRDFSGRYA